MTLRMFTFRIIGHLRLIMCIREIIFITKHRSMLALFIATETDILLKTTIQLCVYFLFIDKQEPFEPVKMMIRY